MKNSLRLSFVIIAFAFVTFAHANVQPVLNNNTFSFANVLPSGGWGNQVDRTVIIGAAEGITKVNIMKDGALIGTFSFNAPAEYKYLAPTKWTGEYIFIIENQNTTTEFVAKF